MCPWSQHPAAFTASFPHNKNLVICPNICKLAKLKHPQSSCEPMTQCLRGDTKSLSVWSQVSAVSCSRSLSVSTTVQDGGTHGAVANCPDCPPLPTQGKWEEVSHGVIQSADTELTMAISKPIWSKVNNNHCWFHVDLLQNSAAAMFGESLSSVPRNLVSVSRLLTICSVLQYCHLY